ncbi:MAG: hypothetical protein ABSA74_01870 [Candidatus Staskawiczbacteria bacterium]|jgi:hypothetical protein
MKNKLKDGLFKILEKILWKDHLSVLMRKKESINNRFWMFLYYFFILVPVSLILRLFGRKFLELKLFKGGTYWKDCKEKTNYQETY